MKKRILAVFGAGGLARELLELARIINNKENRWYDFFFVDKQSSDSSENDTKIVTFEYIQDRKDILIEAIVAIGQPLIRKRIYKELEEKNINIVSLIHPDIVIPKSTKIGKGVVIQSGCFISCNVIIEDYVYIQPNCNIGHDVVLKKGCMISGLGNLAGAVVIGAFSFIGLSCAIKEGVSIGDNSIVGMGSIVFKDIPDEVIALGNPARGIAKNNDGIVR